jgi:hypothetical protein
MDQLPREDMIASQEDRALQARHPWQCEHLDQRVYMTGLRDEAIADGASAYTHWIYFRSNDWTWRNECGLEGWLLVDYMSLTQHAFLLRVIS